MGEDKDLPGLFPEGWLMTARSWDLSSAVPDALQNSAKGKKKSFPKAKTSWKWQKNGTKLLVQNSTSLHPPHPAASKPTAPASPRGTKFSIFQPSPAGALPYQVSRRGGSSRWKMGFPQGCPGSPGSPCRALRVGTSPCLGTGATLVTLGCALEGLRPILQSQASERRRKTPHSPSSLCMERDF